MRKIIVVLVSTLNFIIVNDKVERTRRHTKHDLFLSEIQPISSVVDGEGDTTTTTMMLMTTMSQSRD